MPGSRSGVVSWSRNQGPAGPRPDGLTICTVSSAPAMGAIPQARSVRADRAAVVVAVRRSVRDVPEVRRGRVISVRKL